MQQDAENQTSDERLTFENFIANYYLPSTPFQPLIYPGRLLEPEEPPVNYWLSAEIQNKQPCSRHQEPNAFIFNVINFDKEHNVEKRDGTNEDADAMRKILHEFKFNVKQIDDPTDLYIDKFKTYLNRADFTSHKCLVIVILSHVLQNETILLKRGLFRVDDLLHPMISNKTLHGKPKIFFIQACKGKRATGAVPKPFKKTDEATEVQNSTAEQPKFYPLPTDVLKFYSTYEEYNSFRNDFIQVLAKHLRKNGRKRNIKRICEDVADEFKSRPEEHQTQVPSLTQTPWTDFILGTCNEPETVLRLESEVQ